MSYDVSKLTNLGQMKSALQRLNQEVIAAKSVRQTLTISPSNWATYDSIKRYNTGITTTNYHYYYVHLDPSESITTSRACANADIRVQINNAVIYLMAYNYPSSGLSQFNIEVVITPTTTNGTGLSYDIGDKYLAIDDRLHAQESKMSTLRTTTIPDLDTRITTLETNVPLLLLQANSITIPVHKWVASTASDASTYSYMAVLTVPNVTADYFPVVQFNNASAALFDFKPSAVSGAGTVTIYCKDRPDATVTIDSLFCYKGTTVTVS